MTKFAFTVDTETYPNCFLLVARICGTKITFTFEISTYKDDSVELYRFLNRLANIDTRLYGFNIVGFDGPLIHTFMRMGGKVTPQFMYEKAMRIIQSQENDKFAHMVKPADRDHEWVDLYRINHFHNRARATSLKALEFVMKMDDIEDLPFPVGTVLNKDQVRILREYCVHDVVATDLFREKCIPAIEFREQLGVKYDRDFMNADDVKIGSTIFEIMLEEEGVTLYNYGPDGRTPKQTRRSAIALKDAILSWIKFEQSEFQRVLNWLRDQVITETKGVFNDLTAVIDGFTYVFGLGGLHGAVEMECIEASDTLVIESWDVSSYYPNLSISNRFYPEHLGDKFCDVYKKIYDLRKTFKKGTAENAAYKLAANGTYGKSNDQFSPFLDPLLTMRITLNGQLLLCVLIEQLIKVPTLTIKVCNTDGLEYTIHPDHVEQARQVCKWWESITRLQLENARYSKLFMRDVNNYLGVFEDGSIKRKGAYEYDLEYHQNHSALVIPKVAEQVLVHNKSIRETVMNWPDKMDFMLRVKVPRSSHLKWGGRKVQNTTRYYVSTGGAELTKVMPPLAKNPEKWREFAIEKGWTVQVCNDITHAFEPINFEYYIQEVEKLCLAMK